MAFRSDNRYSRIVNLLKVLFPISALGLLSTMFLLSKSVDPTTSITFARVNLDELDGEQRITAPRFSSVTKDGTAVSFSAESAIPTLGKVSQFSAKVLVAQIDMPTGARIDINAPAALIDGINNVVELIGGVVLKTSLDYEIQTAGVVASMETTSVRSTGAVTVEGPLGRIQAGQVELTQNPLEENSYLLVFKDGVKLIYKPQADAKGP